jgi:signal peptidase I
VILTEISGDRPYRVRVDPDSPKGGDFSRVKVPNGHCFVLGDNRADSVDSRQIGPIPLADVLGRVDFIYWPAETWARFGAFESE